MTEHPITDEELQKQTTSPHWRYLRGYMLDYDNFEVIEIIPQNKRFAATIMHDRREESIHPWCVQYAGNGHYFATRGELDTYCRRRGWYRRRA